MIDRELVEKKFDIIEENVAYLKSVRRLDARSFASSFEKVQAAKHSLQEAIEACLDIANHMISSEGFRRAEEYSQMFEVLAENGIIADKLKSNLMRMARFRNLLVHRYGEVDSRKLHSMLKTRLADFGGFMRAVSAFMRKRKAR